MGYNKKSISFDGLLVLDNAVLRNADAEKRSAKRARSIAAGINGVKGVPASLQATSLQVADSRLRSDGRKRGVLAA